ncbi:Protein of unknown function (DUF3537 [Striga hermonthica]|uniref:Uncharacterized protein n=1 Tax=Striga hermonthica TaxID=68872 RepID=A0A9N7RP91_STRHE|nr:Protein of unknown function (DUF3537 [Striga hermonthica]
MEEAQPVAGRAFLVCFFFLLNIGVPIVSHFVFSCSACDPDHQRPYDAVVQQLFSLFAAVSFASLSSFARKYGLRRFLFLDKLCDESERVRQGYTHQLHRSMKLLSTFVLPCFFMNSLYKIWSFSSVGNQIPYLYNVYLSKVIVCILLMWSWLCRISICFLVCVLFRLSCCLQILRLEEFGQVFEKESDVASILIEHLRIRRHLRVISHRFRLFILLTLILVTISQLLSLLVTLERSSPVNLSTAGELALYMLDYPSDGSLYMLEECSQDKAQGPGCDVICLRSAAKITHKAQAVTSLAAKWHVCATIDTFDELPDDTWTMYQIMPAGTGCEIAAASWDSDSEADDVLDNTKLVPIYTNTISYQKRQAIGKTLLHTIFAIQLSLTLRILNKTIGIS